MVNSKVYPLTDPVALAAKIKAAGGPAINPTQESGTATADGVTIEWGCGDGKVLLTILKKPFFISYATIWSHVDAVFGS